MVRTVSIKAYDVLIEEIQLLQAQKGFPIKNDGVFIAVGYLIIEDWWKDEPDKIKFHKEMIKYVHRLINKKLIHEKSKGIKRLNYD